MNENGRSLKPLIFFIFVGFCIQFDGTGANPQWRNGRLSVEPFEFLPENPVPQTLPDSMLFNKEIIHHPWQISSVPLGRQFPPHYDGNPNVDDLFYRSKRRNDYLHPVPSGDNDNKLAQELSKMARQIKHSHSSESGIKIKSAKIGAKWPSVSIHPYSLRRGSKPGTRSYNPLPYGIPYPNSASLAEGSQDQPQHGLPFARRPLNRNKAPEPFRLPIPDSEIHYRKPVNDSILRAYHEIVNEQNSGQLTSSPTALDMETKGETSYRSGKSNDAESFRVLIDVIKSLMATSSEKITEKIPNPQRTKHN